MTVVKLDKFVPRPHQRGIFKAMEQDGYRKAILTWSRRNGKDVTAFNLMIRMAFKKVGSYAYFLPTFTQARRVIWESILDDGTKFLDFIPKELIKRKREQNMSIELINGSEIFLGGSDSYDRLVGINLAGIVYSEAALMQEEAITYLKPIIASNGGWVLFISTPRSHNFYYDLWNIAKENPNEWYWDLKTAKDTGNVSLQEIEEDIERGEISRDKANQEYFCDFSSGSHGAYYDQYLQQLRVKDQIGSHVVWDITKPVYTAWDLGVSDLTVILFYQIHGRAVHIIEEYSNNSEGLDHYTREIQSRRDYRYSAHFAPHDISVRDFTSKATTRLDIARRLGVKFNVLAKASVSDGIESVRVLFPRLFIHSSCKGLIKALENYRRIYNNSTKRYEDKPFHDLHSNFCDAIRYLAQSLPNILAKKGQQSVEEYREMRMQAKYGNTEDYSAPIRRFKQRNNF